MNRAIVTRTLRDLRWQVFWYGTGLAVYGALMVLLFPTFEGFLADVEYPEEFLSFFGAAGDLSDPRYFLQAEYFSFAPLILMVFAVVAGTGLLAGDEGRGTLEMLLAQPVARSAVLASRVAGMLVALLTIVALTFAGWLISVPFVDLDGLGLGALLAASFVPVPLVTTFAGLSVLLAAVAPSRGQAAGIMTAVAITSYLVASFALTLDAIAWTRWLTPYHYSNVSQVLTEGVVWWHQGILLLITVVTFGLARMAFEGREIGAGTWQPRAIARGWRSGRRHAGAGPIPMPASES